MDNKRETIGLVIWIGATIFLTGWDTWAGWIAGLNLFLILTTLGLHIKHETLKLKLEIEKLRSKVLVQAQHIQSIDAKIKSLSSLKLIKPSGKKQ